VDVNVEDFSNVWSPLDAKEIYRKELVVQSAELERLMLDPKVRRDEALLQLAHETAEKHNVRFE